VTVVAAGPALPPLAVYDAALRDGDDLLMASADGGLRRLDVKRWTGAADAADRRLVARCPGPVVDLGCGPGRLVVALAARGVPALGVDLSARAVAMALARGAVALRRDIFAGRLPGEGRWAGALLADGNIGIGGDPVRLLRRTASLIRPGGTLLVEADPNDVDERTAVWISGPEGTASSPFPWASVGAPALMRVARLSGWRPAADWDDDGRRFVTLTRT
jgi:SAM-dependent methyltransferase